MTAAYQSNGRMWIRRRLGWVVFAVACLTTVSGAPPKSDIPELPQVKRPSFSLPSQEAFRDWATTASADRVLWLPWSDATFDRAVAFGRPVFFVMSPAWSRRAQFVFSDILSLKPIVREVNEKYIAILSHPDLRPDLRERYQTGLWPTQILLLPNGDPMVSQVNDAKIARPITLGGVDPKAIRYWLSEGDVYWERWALLLYEVGGEWADREGPNTAVPGVIGFDAVRDYVVWLLEAADPQGGGFGVAPKRIVPELHALSWLQRSRFRPALELHAVRTIEALLDSPLYDKKFGGLYRIAGEPEYGNIQYEKTLKIQISWLEELIGLQRTRPNAVVAEELERTARRILEAYRIESKPGFSNAQVADPLSRDGGGFERGEHDTEPVFEKIVLSGQSALAAARVLEAARILNLPDVEIRAKSAFDEIFQAATNYGAGSVHSLMPLNRQDRFLWSQADLAWACWQIYQLTGDSRALEGARQLVQFVEANMKIEGDPRWIDHLPHGVERGLMKKPRFPVIPNIRMARVVRRLAIHDGVIDLEKRGRMVVESLCGDLAEYRENGIPIAVAVEEYAAPPVLARIQGAPDDPTFRALQAAWSRSVWPWSVTRYDPQGEASIIFEWKGKTVTVTDPARVDATVKNLTGWIPDEGGD